MLTRQQFGAIEYRQRRPDFVSSRRVPRRHREHSIAVTLPPLAVAAFRKR